MAPDPLSDVVSSKTRLQIANSLSTRPRPLGELADLTGISIQGVLRHLVKLRGLGLVDEQKIAGPGISVRKVYVAKGSRVQDFSVGDLTVVKISENAAVEGKSQEAADELEYLAEEAILQRKRISDQVKKLGRMIDMLAESQSKMSSLLSNMDLNDEDRLVLQALYTEDTIEDGAKVLTKHFGIKDGRRSIEKALARARRSGEK